MYPLKQGLKPVGNLSAHSFANPLVEVVYPLKQGLKQLEKNILTLEKRWVEVVYPLKQGLKHSVRKVGERHRKSFVEVVYPLKQGLKPD